MGSQVIFPDVPISLRGGRPLVLLNPREVNPFYKIADGDNALRRNCATVHCYHVTFRFLLDVGGRALAARRHRPKAL
jgi:hypothetical protein